MSKPFQALPFRSLPQQPRRPHDYLTLPVKDVDVPVGAETVRIRYREVGEGPALTLVHGLMTSGYSFRYVATPLAEAGYRVLIPDLPGAGRAIKARCEFSVVEYQRRRRIPATPAIAMCPGS